MKTGSWTTVGPVRGRIGISLGSPRRQAAGYRLYRPLAPAGDMLRMSYEGYYPRYQEILAALDPQKVWDEVHALAGVDGQGRQIEPILLCFEVPPWSENNWCHRRMAAKYLEGALGVSIPELGFEDDSNV
ncbi:MAG TPA: hypothetical protein VFE10_10380 [Phenylobacterium sp.]|nr:hypothetical protein [Phenylobacterium sp.]